MEEYERTTLSNGLTLITVPRLSTEVLTAIIMFGIGSKYESEDIAGISHVLEHMFFKGTKKRPTGLKISEFIDSIGGEYNAFTDKEYTGYYVKVTPSHLTDGLDFLSDILQNSLFDPKELEREKNVIVEEIKMYEDLPPAMAEMQFERAILGDNDFGREIIGYRESVKAVTKEKLINYKNNHYNSGNATLVLAGNFGKYGRSELEKMAQDYFHLPEGSKSQKSAIKISDKKGLAITKKNIEQANIIVGFRTVPNTHPDHYKLCMLSMILGGSASSRMFEEVREKRGLAYSVRTTASDYAETGLLCTQAGVPHEKAKEAIAAIIGEYKKIKTTQVPQTEMAKALETIKGKLLIKFEDSEELAYHYAVDDVVCKKITSPKEMIEIYSKITADDILEVAKKYLTDERMGISLVGKEISSNEIDRLLKI